MKKYAVEQRPKVVLVEAACDLCGADCVNSSFDIQCQASFSEQPRLIETLCWNCWDKNYRQKEQDKADQEYKQLLIRVEERAKAGGHVIRYKMTTDVLPDMEGL